jgi:1-acyl-sn-glycerol-3-phosphate acyltransferase
MNSPSKTHSWVYERARRRGFAVGEDPTDHDPEFITTQLERMGRLFGRGRWFDVHASGFENIPDGPVLLVGNHSGGTMAMDGWGLAWAWYDHFGPEVPLHALMHELVFGHPRVGRYFARGGMLRAGWDTARSALVDHGRAVVVMPGGDRDVWRPSRARDRVQFAGRTGYARLAVKLGVPIVPVAHVGAHDTFWVLTDGHALANRVPGLKRLARASIFPVHVSAPWGLAVGPWPHLPPPTRFDYRFGAPILPPAQGSDEARTTAMDHAVRDALQQLILDVRRDRPPLRTRARERLEQLRNAWRRR